MRPKEVNIHRKDSAIYDLVKNDIPIPEEYQNMDFGDLIDGITKNEIPVVCLFRVGTDFTLYWPGKEPQHCHYGNEWGGFVTTLQNKGKLAEKEEYPVMVMGFWSCKGPSPRCRWCGADVEKKPGKSIPFCKDTDCKDRYKKFQYLLKSLVKNDKITEEEKEFRLNPYFSIIQDTQHNSYYLRDALRREFEVEGMALPEISDRCFIVTSDNNVVFEEEDRVCDNCGAHISGHGRRRFCSDKCRFDHHNEKKKLRD